MKTNAIVILYKGSKPEAETIRKIASVIAKSGCSEEVIDMTHFTNQDIANAIVATKVLAGKTKKVSDDNVTIVINPTDNENNLHLTANNLARILGISVDDAMVMVKSHNIFVPKTIDPDVITSILCSYENTIVDAPSAYAISQAEYVMRSFSGRFWDLVNIVNQARKGVQTKETIAIKNAIEILQSPEAVGALNRLDPVIIRLIRST